MLLSDPADLHQREKEYHDQWANNTDLASIKVLESFEGPTAFDYKFIVRTMGPLAGLRLLDVGAGFGESSVYFALQGACVTMTDISPGMVNTAVALGRRYGVELAGVVSTGEDLMVPPESYDIVYVANVIHHVHDRPALFGQVLRALKPGGRFFSIDPVAYNPLINQYRRMAVEVRTPDETPLRRADLALARQFFPDLKHREFWIAALGLFVKYAVWDRVHPDDERYWKRMLRETDRTLLWWKPLLALDAVLTRLPGVRWLAWNMVMWGSKPAK